MDLWAERLGVAPNPRRQIRFDDAAEDFEAGYLR